jgi:tRNA (guanine-N7-)-methyltransferase
MLAPRRIRSFVLRAGRGTEAQERALADLWPVYGLDFAERPLDLDRTFGRAAPRCLEIGFGTGEVIASLAKAHPENDYLGIEVHRAGVGRLLLSAKTQDLGNLRIIRHDAVEVLTAGIADSSFDTILIFFPDPWHKKRHHKRRLATDWEDYAEQMRMVCNACPGLVSQSLDGTYVERPDFRPPTRFERRGERLGHGVWDLAYLKSGR